LHLELSLEVLPLEFLVLADVRRDHLADLLAFEKDAEAEVVDAAVVGDDGEILDAKVSQGGDRVFGNAAQTEPAGQQSGSGGDVADGLVRARVDLVHTA